MEEQKNLNNSPVSQLSATVAPKNIPTTAGVFIVLIVVVIIWAGIIYFFRTDFYGSYNNNPTVSSKSLKAQTETVNTKENGTTPQDQAGTEVAAEETVQSATGATFDFDYELKKLDDQNNAVNPDDFNETEMSDVNIGL